MPPQATTATPVERIPWHKQKNESAPAFAAFAVYRDLGPQRSIAAAAQEVAKAVPTLKKWSRTNKWADRVDAYDHHVDERHLAAREEGWLRANQRHQAIAGRVSDALVRRLQGDTRKGHEVKALNPQEIDWDDVGRLMSEVVKIERLVHGQPTDFALRATSMSVGEALFHVRTLIESARQLMPPEMFAQHLVTYAGATQIAPERPRELTT